MNRATALAPAPAPARSPLASLQPARVAVFRALQLGDMLCAVPALRSLRQALPNARITLVGLPWARDFAARFGAYVDDFLCFPGYAALPEQVPDVSAWPGFLTEAHRRGFDLALQLHGDGRCTNALVGLLGARHQAGFTEGAGDALHLPFPTQGHESRRLLALLRHLGAPADDARPEFPLLPADHAAWQAYPALHTLQALRPQGYVCLHVGARAAERRWPLAQFAALGDALVQASGLPLVLTGAQDEQPLTRALAQSLRVPVVDAALPVPAGALAALLAGARLLVCNDTGVSHLAAALRLPSVVIFRASDPQRWAPLDARRHRAVIDPEGRRVSEVLAAALALLQDGCPTSPTLHPAPV